jgi:hypothetical protein
MYQLKINKDALAKYDYKTVKIAGFKSLKELDLPDNYFGGRVHRIVVLKEEDNLLITDEYHNIIGMLIPKVEEVKVAAAETQEVEVVEEVVEEVDEEVVEETIEEVIDETPKVKITYSCDRCDREFDSALKLGAHKRFCKVEKTGGEEQ